MIKYFGVLGTGILAVALFLSILILLWSLTAIILMVAWNLIVPSLFVGPSVTFFQALGAVILISLAKILFSTKSK